MFPMIDEVFALLYTGLFYAFSFPTGYLLFRWSFGECKLPFFVKLPISLALGLVALTLTLFIGSFFVVSQFAIIFAFLLSLILILVYVATQARKTRKSWRAIGIKQISLQNIAPLVLFAITVVHFSLVAGLFGWPPFGDAINHGLITSLLVANGRTRLDYMPLSPAPLDNPTGFHVVAASFSLVAGILPGESIFVLAAAALILVPALLYCLTYLITRSVILSTSVFLSAFIVHPVIGLDTFLTGYLYNGPYPNLFGLLGSILFCVLAVADRNLQTEKHLIRSKLCMLSVILGLLVIYSPFALFSVAYVLLRLLRKSPRNAYRILRKRWIQTAIIVAVVVVVIVSLLFRSYLYEVASLTILKLGKVSVRSSQFSVTSAFLFSQSGIAVIVATFIAVFFLLKRIHTTLALFFVIIVVPCLASMFEILSSYVTILLPSRSIVIAALLSWVLIFVSVGFALKIRLGKAAHFTYVRFAGISQRLNLHSLQTLVICLVFASTLFAPSIISGLTLGQTGYTWFGLTRSSEDYMVLFWLRENIASKDLILNDYSYVSLYLLSFSIKNVTSYQSLGSSEDRQRATDAHNFWKKPNDYVLFSELVNKYDIKYVLVTSESGYLDWIGVGGDNQYKPKPFGNRTKLVFDNNPYVKILFETEYAGIYKVISELAEYNFTEITDDNQRNFWLGEAAGSGTIGPPALSDDSDVKMSGDDSLKISVRDGTYAHVSITHPFSEPINWSQQDFIVFYWFGNKTEANVEIFVKGPTAFDYKLYSFVENWIGWRLVVLPLHVPTATYGNPDLTEVTQIQFTIPNAPQGTWNLDQLALATKGQ